MARQWDETAKADGLAERLRAIRADLYGAHGGPTLAEVLEVPHATWHHYESGVTIPGLALLRFIAATRANPHWLLTGQGERYSPEIDHCRGASGR
jgi:hypothetical protein